MTDPGGDRSAKDDYEWLRREMKLTMERAQERGMKPRHFIALLQRFALNATERYYEAVEAADGDDQC